MRGISKLVGVGAAIGIVLTTAMPASAVVSKSGSKNCPAGQVIVLTAKGDEWLRFYLNGSLRYETYQLSIASRTWKSNSNSATWKITSTGYLNDDGTYATCVDNNITPAPPA